ncbi:cell division initiation protein [Kitasatospora sp. YST-16]|uniref:cell division initiation protein n=1 Tax=Kitasatospora sp. YST-16 TaxID=2998080 RepID=UPI00228370BA|nr:cell division initiation protein [Kitasatospora sp. YST-16]WAL73986.1 cell division initiation protein [Kitasatospora sp. YST-16]WNW40061.1 cell division initiation protein [Streptomyces sp. Li-HN-5-13]
MDVQQKLDEIIAVVEKAKAMPMSSSCVVNRAELTGLLRDLREAMPAELAQAQSVVADHQQMVADAQAQADHIIRGAHDERGSLISDTEVVRQAQAEADRVLAEARTEVQTKLAEADDYVDSKLANFEVVLTKTLGAVGRGRQKLRGDSGVYEPEQDGAEDGEEFRPRTSPSPEADEYVDVKLATLEAVLSATLEAVGKGRDKLLGKAPIDELGAYLAAADEAQQLKDRAEAVAAGFADGAAPEDPQNWYADVPQQQSWPEQTPAAAGWQQPGEDPYGQQQAGEDPYGQQQAPQYAEAYGGGYDPAAAPQADPYGQPYGQQQPVDPYYQQQPQYQQPQGFDQWGNPLPVDPYGYQQQPQQQAQLPQQQAGLDETSFFDTSMIDMTRLRELGGR